jgi:hypothetical protein
MKFMNFLNRIKKAIRQRPIGINIIALLFLITGIISFLISFDFYYLQDILIETSFKKHPEEVLIYEVIFFVLGIMFFVGGKALWKLEEWARVFIYWLSLLSIPSAICSLVVAVFAFQGTFFEQLISIGLALLYGQIHLAIALYLRKNTIKAYFSPLIQQIIQNQISDRNANFVKVEDNKN